ncbi:MAG TPA: hypothetical protein VN634_11065 [Candidatus Limnocylindrales bacterium]|nr:hypothetical protein [Candidatus Limnocylindrales bacterium]
MTFRATVYPPLWRNVSALLFLVSRGSLLVLLALLLFFETRLSNPLRLIRVFAETALLPGIAGWLVARFHRATLEVRDGMLAVELPARRIEIPCNSIDGATPWPIPLPSGGLWLELESGRRFPYGIEVANPSALVEAIGQCADPDRAGLRIASQGIARAYAEAAFRPAGAWYRPVLKYVVFALVPAVPLFRLHQWITYGGTFGEYYMYGLQAYLIAFAIYWAHAAIWLILLDTALATIGAAITLAAAFVVPPAAAGVGRAMRIARSILFYGSVPVFLLRLFLLS